MALYNEILVGRYNRFFQKFFGIKGGPPAPQLTSEITPSFPLFSGVENRYLEGWDRFALTQSVAAVAAQNSLLRLRNPSTSNVLAVLEKVSVIEATADTVFFDVANPDADLTGPVAGFNVDTRGRPRSALIMSGGNNINTGNTIGHVAFTAGNSGEFILFDDQELVLLPGSNFNARTNAVNVILRMSVLWRERALEEGEKT